MTDGNAQAAGVNVAFRSSRAKRVHGLVIAGVLAAVGLLAMFAAGPALPDGQLIGLVNLALAGGVVVYSLRTHWSPGVGMVLDDDGLWFRDWGLPPVPWRHVRGAHMVGIRLRPLLCVELGDADAFLGRSMRRRAGVAATTPWSAAAADGPQQRAGRAAHRRGGGDPRSLRPRPGKVFAVPPAQRRLIRRRATRVGPAKAHAPRHTVGQSKRASSRGDR